jgi:hypothetical protein
MLRVARIHARTSGETNGEVTNVLEGSKKPFEGTPQNSHVNSFISSVEDLVKKETE